MTTMREILKAGIGLALTSVIWASLGTAPATADPVNDYARQHASAVCGILDAHPDDEGVRMAVQHVQAVSGLPKSDGGQVVEEAVDIGCPAHRELVAGNSEAPEDAGTPGFTGVG